MPVRSATSLMAQSVMSMGDVGASSRYESGASRRGPSRRPGDDPCSMTPRRSSLTGATGYVGGQLLARAAATRPRRPLPRRATRRAPTCPTAPTVVEGDVATAPVAARGARRRRRRLLPRPLDGRGKGGDFAERDRAAADELRRAPPARPASRASSTSAAWSGGDASEHLRSREEVAEHPAPSTSPSRPRARRDGHRRRQRVVPDAAQPRRAPAGDDHARAGSTRAPSPSPIARRRRDARRARRATTDPPGEVQLGGADVLTYREMMQPLRRRRRPPRRRRSSRVPVLTPRLSSYWVGARHAGRARPRRAARQGLSAEMVVRTPPPAGLNDDPLGFDDAVRAALAA